MPGPTGSNHQGVRLSLPPQSELQNFLAESHYAVLDRKFRQQNLKVLEYNAD